MVKSVETLYMIRVKSLTGVRSTTPNLTCLSEAVHGMSDDPMWYVLEIAMNKS